MTLQRSIAQNDKMTIYKAMGLLLFFIIFLFLSDTGDIIFAATVDDMGAGVLIKGFEFFRPNKPPESEDLAVLKERRRQIESMIRSEQERQEKAAERTRKNILAHIDFLQRSLKQIDDEIFEEGDTLVPSQVLHKITADYRDQELTLEDMNIVADLVTMAYQEKGYILARAYVPEQEIEDGILRIAIVEGDVGDIKVTGQTYYDERVIKRNFMEQLRHGVIREELLEKGLLLTKELPDAETRVVLERGEEPGTANIALQTDDRVAFDWKIDFNNFGSEYVGKERYGTKMEITDPWWGSTLSIRGVTGTDMKESALKSADLSIPFSDYGTKLNLRYLEGRYIVGQDLVDLGINGVTKIYGAGISHPFLRTRNKNLTLSAGFENKFTRSYQLDALSNVDDLKVGYLVLDYDSLDRFLGKNLASIGYYFGSLQPDSEAPFTRGSADYRFNHYNLNLARIQKIYGNINVMIRGSLQVSNDNLLPIEQMAIGGYGTVRGHNTSIFLGDSGTTFSVEFLSAPPFIADKVLFGQRIAQMVQLALFYDTGRVKFTDPQPGEYKSDRLSGWGGGLRFYYKDLFTFKFDMAFPTEEKIAFEDPLFLYFMSSINLTSDEFRLIKKKLRDFFRGSPKETAGNQSPK